MKVRIFIQIMLLLLVEISAGSSNSDVLLIGYKNQVPDWFQVEVDLLSHKVYCRGKIFDRINYRQFSSSLSYQYHFDQSDLVKATFIILSDFQVQDTTIVRWPPKDLEVFYFRRSSTMGCATMKTYNCGYRLIGSIRDRILRHPERFNPIRGEHFFAPLDSSTISAKIYRKK